MKCCFHVVICCENVRSPTGDNSNTQLLYRDVIICLLRSFIASWRIFIFLLIFFCLLVFSRNMWARVETFSCLIHCNYLLFILFIAHGYNSAIYVLFLYLHYVIPTAVIQLHWIRDSKLHCKSVEPCFVTQGIYEPKNPKLILSHSLVLQCSLINPNDMFYFWLYVIITLHL
jgi:hypothetical protein